MCVDGICVNTDGASSDSEERKSIKKVSELDGRCAYFPLADYHNIRIFKEYNYNKKGKNISNDIVKNDILNRFYLALLLFDTVILHCSDPLRSEIIYEILCENISLIKNEKIVFIFSNSINDIGKDYKEYITQRKEEYNRNEFSETDISSLQQPHMTDDFYKKVIEILKKTHYIYRKGKEGSVGFKTLIQNDLDNNVELPVMGNNSYATSHIRLLNLTLYQLLNLKYISKDNIESVFEFEKIEEFIDSWISESETSSTAPFSRHTIVEQLRKECVTGNKVSQNRQMSVISVIETRLSLLYSKLNCGAHQIIEFHPATEKRSVYNWRYFKNYMSEIAENRNVFLNSDKIVKIRDSVEWENFRNEFLACMAELNGQVVVSQRTELKNSEPDNEMFLTILKKHKISNKYSNIKKILMD